MVDMHFSLDSNQYNFISLLGRGSFSKVYQAECVTNNKHVAIKVMDLESINTSFEDILQEVQTMKLSDHKNILRCYCSFVESNQLWLVMQLMDLGSCLRVMNISKSRLQLGEGLNEEWIGYILCEAVSGLNYLHSNGQIHRDIKSGNILIDSQGNVRLADFGVSGWTVARGLRQDTVKTFVGTPSYMAPEVMAQNEGYDNRADIWSVGITALELAKGYAPYAHHSPMRVLVLTLEEEPPGLRCYPDNLQRTKQPFSSLFEDFYKKCLHKNPKGRPTAEELLKHKFLKGRSAVRNELVTQLLAQVGSVGGSNSELNENNDEREKLPGETSVSVTIERWDYESNGSSRVFDNVSDNSQHKSFEHPKTAAASNSHTEYAAGTSWVFDSEEVNEWRSTQGSENEGATHSNTYTKGDSGSNGSVKVHQSGVMHRVQHALTESHESSDNNSGSVEEGVGVAKRVSGGSDSYKITVQGLGMSHGESESDSVTFNRHTSSGIHQIKLSQSQSQHGYQSHSSPFHSPATHLPSTIKSTATATNPTTATTTTSTPAYPKVQSINGITDKSVTAPEIDDFLSDFEKEIVIPESVHSSNPSSRPNSMKLRSGSATNLSSSSTSSASSPKRSSASNDPTPFPVSSSSSSSSNGIADLTTNSTSHTAVTAVSTSSSSSSSSAVSAVVVPADASQPAAVSQESTASFMDELEDIVDGRG